MRKVSLLALLIVLASKLYASGSNKLAESNLTDYNRVYDVHYLECINGHFIASRYSRDNSGINVMFLILPYSDELLPNLPRNVFISENIGQTVEIIDSSEFSHRISRVLNFGIENHIFSDQPSNFLRHPVHVFVNENNSENPLLFRHEDRGHRLLEILLVRSSTTTITSSDAEALRQIKSYVEGHSGTGIINDHGIFFKIPEETEDDEDEEERKENSNGRPSIISRINNWRKSDDETVDLIYSVDEYKKEEEKAMMLKLIVLFLLMLVPLTSNLGK